MKNLKKYVVIGNGTAAVGCIEGIRSADKSGKITVISGENRHVYCRPLISYYLEGKTDLDRIAYRPSDFYDKNNCTVIYDKAVKIDAENRCVLTDGGKKEEYDRLCVCTGSTPFVPPTDGYDNVKNKFTFLTLDDALGIEKAINERSRVLIVGAGLIGLKCAEGLSGRVASITVCDLADRILSSIFDSDAAAVMQAHLGSHGIKFMLGDTAVKYTENTAEMKSGKTVEFDILISAVGVRPNTKLISDIGGAVTRGITVDDHMRTSVDGIYAAGDCTESTDISDGKVKIMALMPNAYIGGRCAGSCMSGKESSFANAIPMNSIGFFGLHAMTAGSRFDKKDGGEVYEERDGEGIKKLFTKGDRLTGFMLIGKTDGAGIYTDMIRSKTPLTDVDFGKLKKSPDISAYDEKKRRKILGGVV